MRGSRSRWIVAVATVALAVPVATAQGHPAGLHVRPGEAAKQIGGHGRRRQHVPAARGRGHARLVHAGRPRSAQAEQLPANPTAPARGMNAAIAVHKNYVYVGSRTDGKNNNANHAGIMIVDVANPAHPTIVQRDGPAVRGQPAASPRASCACGARRTS